MANATNEGRGWRGVGDNIRPFLCGGVVFEAHAGQSSMGGQHDHDIEVGGGGLNWWWRCEGEIWASFCCTTRLPWGGCYSHSLSNT